MISKLTKAIVIRIVWYSHKDRHINQCSNRNSSEIKPVICGCYRLNSVCPKFIMLKP